MNPLTNVHNTQKLNERELDLGIPFSKSWHQEFKDSAYIFVGGIPFGLNEGDIISVFSQYGEIQDINLIRDKSTGKIKGFGFIAYQDQRSTVLAVDNLNGAKLGGRTIRVAHVKDYKRPEEDTEAVKQETQQPPGVSGESMGRYGHGDDGKSRLKKEKNDLGYDLAEVGVHLPGHLKDKLLRKLKKKSRKEISGGKRSKEKREKL